MIFFKNHTLEAYDPKSIPTKTQNNKKNFYKNIYMLFFVCFVFWTKQQLQQLQFVQYDGLTQHPNPNFQMLEDVIMTWVFQSMQEEEEEEEEEEILTLISIKKISILVIKEIKSREFYFIFLRMKNPHL
jgi:hypothetical protein